MPANEPSEEDIYRLILSQLAQFGCEELILKIRGVVMRGAVTAADEELIGKNAQLVRPMLPEEQLAVALRFLITALQLPLMENAAEEAFECKEIVWLEDGAPAPPDAAESHAIPETKMPLFGEQQAPVSDEAGQPEDVGRDALVEKTRRSAAFMELDVEALKEHLTRVLQLEEAVGIRFPELV